MAKKKKKALVPEVVTERPVKCTQAEISERVKRVQRLLLGGHTRAYILQYASKKGWGVTDRQVDDYISKASSVIKEINKVSMQENHAIITTELWKLYRESRSPKAKGKFGWTAATSLQILNQIAKLKGLEKTTLVIEDKREFEDLTDEELDAILEADDENAEFDV